MSRALDVRLGSRAGFGIFLRRTSMGDTIHARLSCETTRESKCVYRSLRIRYRQDSRSNFWQEALPNLPYQLVTHFHTSSIARQSRCRGARKRTGFIYGSCLSLSICHTIWPGITDARSPRRRIADHENGVGRHCYLILGSVSRGSSCRLFRASLIEDTAGSWSGNAKGTNREDGETREQIEDTLTRTSGLPRL